MHESLIANEGRLAAVSGTEYWTISTWNLTLHVKMTYY